MATANAEVSSAALRGLQENLNRLSDQIKEICNTMNSDRTRISQDWRDSKFEEFSNGFQPQIDRCMVISEHYHDWGIRVLDPAAAKVELIENADVVSGGSSGAGVGGGGFAGVGGGGTAAATSAVSTASRIGSKFNTRGGSATKQTTDTSKSTSQIKESRLGFDNKKTTKPNVQTKPVTSASKSENTAARTKEQSIAKNVFAQANEFCKEDKQSDTARATFTTAKDAEFSLGSKNSETGSSHFFSGKLSGDVKTDFKIPYIKKGAEVTAGVEGEAGYNSGHESSENTGNYNFKCVDDVKTDN